MSKITKKEAIDKINLIDTITNLEVHKKEEEQKITLLIEGTYKQKRQEKGDKMTKEEFNKGMTELKELLSFGLNNMNQKLENVKKDIDNRFDEIKKDIDNRFNVIEQRLDKVDNRLDNIEQRLDKVETRLDKIEHDVNLIKSTPTIHGQLNGTIKKKEEKLCPKKQSEDHIWQ